MIRNPGNSRRISCRLRHRRHLQSKRDAAARHSQRVNSSFPDWELVVVGDACTDDTAACVSSFNDPRIRFDQFAQPLRRPVRPEQSRPHPGARPLCGVPEPRRPVFPDRLASCIAGLGSSGADLVWVAGAIARPKADPTGDWPFSFALHGVPATLEYTPLATCLASSWVFRRDLPDRVGPWRSPDQAFVTPSQDWLFRAWRSGAVLRFLPAVTVIVVLAGPRPGSYSRRDSPDHDRLAQALKDDPRCRERILEEAAVNKAMGHFLSHRYPTLGALKRLLLRPVYYLLARIGIHPLSLPIAIVFGRRGSVVRNHRRITGAR